MTAHVVERRGRTNGTSAAATHALAGRLDDLLLFPPEQLLGDERRDAERDDERGERRTVGEQRFLALQDALDAGRPDRTAA